MKVFVSYSNIDKSFVDILIKDLTYKGLEVIIAEKILRPGDVFYEKIGSILQTVDVVLIIISNESLRSDWLNLELSLSLSIQNKRDSLRIIPILLDKVEDLPPVIRNIKYFDFTNTNLYIQNINELIVIILNNYKKTIGDLKLMDIYNAMLQQSELLEKEQEIIESANRLKFKKYYSSLLSAIIISLFVASFTVLIKISYKIWGIDIKGFLVGILTAMTILFISQALKHVFKNTEGNDK